ncbi:MAG: carbon storage regulator [Oscillospiraceae bacterium]
MLVITRKNDESFYIGDDIKIVIVKASNNLVKIGIEAPKSITIARSELRETREQNQQAANANNNFSSIIKSLKENL